VPSGQSRSSRQSTVQVPSG